MVEKFKSMEGLCTSIFFKKTLDFKNVLKSCRLRRNQVYVGIILKIILNWLKHFVCNEELFSRKKNFINGFINHYCFELFSCFVLRNFLSYRDNLFPHETFYFLVKMFILKIILPKVKIFGQLYKKELEDY